MSPAPLGRKTNVDDLQALKAATRRLVDRCGGQESAAMVTRVSHQSLSRYRLADRADDFIPVDVLLDLELDAGEPFVTRVLAQRLGWTMTKVAAAPTTATLHEALGHISKEAADVVAVVAGGLADGDFSRADIDQAIPEIDEAIARLAGLKHALQTMRDATFPAAR